MTGIVFWKENTDDIELWTPYGSPVNNQFLNSSSQPSQPMFCSIFTEIWGLKFVIR